MESSLGCRILSNADVANDVERIQAENGHCSVCLVLLNLIKAAEGADLLSGPTMVNLGKHTALKHAAFLDCASLNCVPLRYTKLWTDVTINRGKMFISI